MVAHRRSGAIRWYRTSAVGWSQEEHDRHRGWKEHLSGGHRRRVRRIESEGILYFFRKLYLANDKPNRGPTDFGVAARSGGRTRRPIKAGHRNSKSAAAGF